MKTNRLKAVAATATLNQWRRSGKWMMAVVGLSLLAMAATAQAQSLAYSNAVINLNPAGYWPMHELGAAAPGDIETNYGTLGVVGNAYYPDWQTNNGAFIRQVPGPLANGTDKAVWFTNPNNNAGGSSNSLFVPHTSPLATIQMPFSIEMWFMITNLPYVTNATYHNFQGDIIAQGNSLRTCGFRIYFQNAQGKTNDNYAGFNILLYNTNKANQGFQTTCNASPSNAWRYMVFTIDTNRTITAYLDGTLANGAGGNPRTFPANRFDPDFYDPLTIGNGLGNRRGFNGQVSEVAIYTNALSVDQISNHWAIGTNFLLGANAYFDAVTNDHPILYYRMDSAPYTAPDSGTWPVAANYGSAAGNGVYAPGTVPGAVNGTNYSGNNLSPSYPSDVASVNVAPLSGVSSYADVGNGAAYNPAGTTPFTVTAFFRGNPTDTSRAQSIAGHGTNSWELGIAQSGYLVFNSGTNSADAVGTGTGAGDLVSTTTAGDDGHWHWVAAVHNGTTNVLYLDGIANNTNVVAADSVGNSLDMLIGSDPGYTYNPLGWDNSSVIEPLGLGAQFAGQVCDVAFFTNALTEAQVRSLYDAAGVAPYFVNDSQSILSRVGNSIIFTTTANGSALAYQWYINTVSNYVGATAMTDGNGVSGSTTASVTITNYSAYYFVVAANNYGSITSQVSSVGSPLTVVGAGKPIWRTSQTNVLVLFSDQLDPATATNAANYSLDNGGSVLSASLVGPNEVSLTTSALNPATTYTLTVQNVKSYYYVAQTPSSTNLVVGLYPVNLALWVRADTNVTTDASGVSGWGDMSGNNNNLIAAGGSYDPQLATNAMGDPVVRFTAANQTLLYANDSPSLRITGNMSIIAVVNFTALAGSTNGEIVSKTGLVHEDVAAPYDYYVPNATTGATISRGNGNTGTAGSGQSTATRAVSQNTPHIVAFSETGNTVSHYLDGMAAGTSVLGNNFNIANSADLGQPLYVGGRTDFGTWLTGDISELIIAGSAMSSYDMAGLDTYLIKQHNLPITIVNTNPTNIVSFVSGNQLTLSWPSDHTGWTLQAQTNSLSVGLGTNWVDIPNSASTNKVVIPINPENGSVFYRLIYQ